MAAATTSELGGFIRGLAGIELTDKDPVDAGITRSVIVNNLNHLTDSHGQCLVNFVSPTTAYDLPSPSTTVFTKFTNLPSFLVPVRLRHDGSTFRIVVNLRASISAAGTATFRIFARFPSRTAGPPYDPSLGYVQSVDDSTTNTTGADIGPKVIYGTRSLVQGIEDRGLMGGTDGVLADGTAEVAPMLNANLEIWAKTSVITSIPRLHSFSAREFVGA